MDDFFKLYRRTSQGKDLAQWIVEDYPDLYENQTQPSAPSKDGPSR
jgi:hypothetical protein